MADDTPFTRIAPELQPILEELRSREPIFHCQGFGQTLADFERAAAPDFWEVGASGRRYTRQFILDMLSRNELVDAAKAGWKATGFGLRQLGPDCFLLTYTLDQAGRRTRRATIWERAAAGWRLVYHQGTIITPNEDNEAPMPEETTPGSREGR